MAICIQQNSGGKGGIAGSGGAEGQPSQTATGAAARSYGFPVIECVTGQTADFKVQLTADLSGEVPANLSNVDKVELVFRPSMNSDNDEIKVPCEFTTDGEVSFKLTPKEVDRNNGVWYAEFLCYSGDALVQDHRAYVCIRKGMRGSYASRNTVTAMDVRMAIFDVSPEANTLLDDLEFSDAMIYAAVERCIDEFNELPPEVSVQYDATNFPWKEALTKGAAGVLLQQAAYRYIRNRMQYSAGGLSMDTMAKGPEYIQLAGTLKQEWTVFICNKKTQINMQDCMGVVASPWYE